MFFFISRRFLQFDPLLRRSRYSHPRHQPSTSFTTPPYTPPHPHRPASNTHRATGMSTAARCFSAPPSAAAAGACRRTTATASRNLVIHRNNDASAKLGATTVRLDGRCRTTRGAAATGVVITGATKGVGFAMAREFLRRGDRVCICGRSQTRLDAAVGALRGEFPVGAVSTSWPEAWKRLFAP